MDALLAVFAGRVTGIPFTSPLAILGAALAVLSLIRRQWLLPAWFAASLVLSYQYAMIPFGMLIGVLAVDLAAFSTRRGDPCLRRWRRSTDSRRSAPSCSRRAFSSKALASAVTVLNPAAPVHALSPERRWAAEWVGHNLESDCHASR